MYGLEKEKRKKFDFDLEIELKKKPNHKKQLNEKIQKATKEITAALKEKEKPKNFEELGILLNGYDALEKVISKIK